MQGITFKKADAVRILHAIEHGEPIDPPTSAGWRHTDLLNLAGACEFAAMTHGPVYPQPDLSPEQKRAAEREFIEDLQGTIEYLGGLFMLVATGRYDELYEETMSAVVYGATRNAVPQEGWKQK